MHLRSLPLLAFGLSLGLIGCAGSSAGTMDSEGSGGSGEASGGSSSGSGGVGSGTGGVGSGTGGAASGGAGTGGSDGSGGFATGGSDGGGGSETGGSDGTGGDATGGGANGDAVPSAGCNVVNGADMLTAGGQSVSGGLSTSTRLSISTGDGNRDYIIDIPDGYDPTTPYRLIFSWHQAYGSANGNAIGQHPAGDGPNFNAQNYAYFGLHRAAKDAGDSAIFVSPQGIGNFPWDYARDVQVFDNILARVSETLCIDESRVFTTGFSFGAMMSHALSVGRANKLRGAVTMAPANYNFTQPQQTDDKVAYFSITGMSDGTCPWVNNDGQKTGGKYCSLTHAEENGCTIPGNLPTAGMGSKNHVCFDYDGCDADYPVKVCTFDGAHTPSSVNNGSSTADDGLNAFIPPLAWEFISQL